MHLRFGSFVWAFGVRVCKALFYEGFIGYNFLCGGVKNRHFAKMVQQKLSIIKFKNKIRKKV